MTRKRSIKDVAWNLLSSLCLFTEHEINYSEWVKSHPEVIDYLFSNDTSLLLNQKAQLARIVASSPQPKAVIERFQSHPSALIRLGIVEGLSNLGIADHLRLFADDPHAKVQKAAVEALEDIDLAASNEQWRLSSVEPPPDEGEFLGYMPGWLHPFSIWHKRPDKFGGKYQCLTGTSNKNGPKWWMPLISPEKS